MCHHSSSAVLTHLKVGLLEGGRGGYWLVQSRGGSMTMGCSLLLLCNLFISEFRVILFPFRDAFWEDAFLLSFLFCFFVRRLWWEPKNWTSLARETSSASLWNVLLCLCCGASQVSVHFIILFPNSFSFFDLHASIGLDIVNLSIELSCVVAVI